MAQYKVGNRILSKEEYESECIGNWAVMLFILGAVMAGIGAHDVLPEEWSKPLRFGLIVVSGGAGGIFAAFLAEKVRTAFFVFLGIGVLALIGNWVWSAI